MIGTYARILVLLAVFVAVVSVAVVTANAQDNLTCKNFETVEDAAEENLDCAPDELGGEGGVPGAQDSAPGVPTAGDAEAGLNCNAETGEVGPGEGTYVLRDGQLVCESQEGENDFATPARIDTGAGGAADLVEAG
jgi:hypothetical protein